MISYDGARQDALRKFLNAGGVEQILTDLRLN
jgi:hypothetical protein